MDSTIKTYGYLDITYLLTSKKLFSWKGLVDLDNEEYVVSYLLSVQDTASPVFILEYWSLWNELQLIGLGTIYLLLPGESSSFLRKVKLGLG